MELNASYIISFLRGRGGYNPASHDPEILYVSTRRRWVFGCRNCKKKLCAVDEPYSKKSDWSLEASIAFKDAWVAHIDVPKSVAEIWSDTLNPKPDDRRPILFMRPPVSVPIQQRPRKPRKPKSKPAEHVQVDHGDRKFNFDL